MKQYGEVIIELRKEKGLSQKQLAEKLGASVQSIARYEKNVTQPSLDVIKKMAKFFGISTSKFLELSKKYDIEPASQPVKTQSAKKQVKKINDESAKVEVKKEEPTPVAEDNKNSKEVEKSEEVVSKEEVVPKEEKTSKVTKTSYEEPTPETPKVESLKHKPKETNTDKVTLGFGGFIKSKPWLVASVLGVVAVILALCAFLIPLRYSTSQMLAKYNPTVFYLESNNSFNETSNNGTGFFINNTGLAVTSYDNVSHYTNGTIKLSNGKKHNITKIVGIDKENNICLVQTDVKKSSPITMGSSDHFIRGDKVFAISYSSTDTLSSAESKIVEGTIQKVEERNGEVVAIQSNAVTENMNKGGILLDSYGNVIAFVSGFNSQERTANAVINNCVPIELVEKVAKDKNVTMQQNLVSEHGTYTIKYNANGGEGEMQNQTALRDYGIVLEENSFTKYGYTFKGWSLNSGINATTNYDADTLVNENLAERDSEVTLFAVWAPTVYNINYHYNGGINSDRYITSYTIENAGTEVILYSESKEGYTFDGWYLDSNFNGGRITSFVIDRDNLKDINLYVKFNINHYNISYTIQNSSAVNNPLNPTTYTVEDDIQLLSPVGIETGYEFKYWYIKNGTTETPVLKLQNEIGNKNLFAKIELKQYPIVYHLNGGENYENNPEFFTIISNNLGLQPATKTGYNFLGWFIDEECTTEFEKIMSGTMGEKNVYAKWKAKESNISLIAGDGTCDTTNLVVTYDEEFSLPTPTSNKAGYVFDYWFAVESATSSEEDGEPINSETWVYDNVRYLKAHYSFIYTISGNSITGLASIGSEFTELTIPESVNETAITAISKNAFLNNKKITNVVLPSSVTTIGEGAFSGCSALKTISMSGVVTISKSAFEYCTMLQKVELPNSTTTIEEKAFYNCQKLKMVILDESSTLTTIGNSAFANCSLLEQFYIPSSVTSLGEGIFSECKGLLGVNFAEGSTIQDLPKNTFHSCTNLLGITNLPSSIVTIHENAFYNCSALTEIIIPTNITNIKNSAFYNCSRLNDVIFNGSVDNWSQITFGNYYSVPMLYSKRITFGEGETSSIELTSSVTKINAMVFYNCKNITSITIPASVVEVSEDAFYNCDNITKTNFTGTLDNWVNINFGNEYANPVFYSKNLFINDTEIENLESVSSATSIGNFAFINCASLTNASVPSTITTIGNSSFRNCANIESLILPNSLLSIGNNAFDKCANITEVTIPANLTSIGARAFIECKNLAKLNFEDADPEAQNVLTELGDSAFYGCTGLTTLVLPVTLTKINVSCFYGCNSLVSVVLSTSVTEIEASAFRDCESLQKIYFEGNQEQFNAITVAENNTAFNDAVKFFYAESSDEVTEGSNFWHYNEENGTIEEWNKTETN